MEVTSLVLRMDSFSPATTKRVERVIDRIESVRARTRLLSHDIAELTRQFLDDDLVEQSGPRAGQPLARSGRIAWLARLAKRHRSYCAACDEEIQLQALLRRMEESLEGSAHRGATGPFSRHPVGAL